MKKLAVVFVVVASATACQAPVDLLKAAPGKYQGFVTLKNAASTAQTLLSAEAKLDGNVISLDSTSASRNAGYLFKVTVTDTRNISLAVPALTSSTRDLKSIGSNCYSSDPAQDSPKARFCFDGREFAIDVLADSGTAASFTFDKIDPSTQPTLETPAAYKLTDLTQRAMNRGFQSQIQFEESVQAKDAARNAYLNLLPHFSFSDIFAFFPTSVQSLIRTVGDFAPFLLPSRWFKAVEAKFQAESELEGWLLMKADSANIAEGLAYNILRDERTLSQLQTERATVASVRDAVQARENLGALPAGSSNNLSAAVDEVDGSILFLQESLKEEYRSLAMAAGFVNPDAITAISADLPGAKAVLEGIDLTQAQNVAIARSLELRQLNSLISEASVAETARLFNWLDPAGDGTGALGAGIYDYYEIGQAQADELKIQLTQMQAMVLQKTANAVTELQSGATAYDQATRDRSVQNDRFQRLQDALNIGAAIDLDDFVTAVQGQIKNLAELANAEFQCYIARSKLDRALFTGEYAEITTLSQTTPVAAPSPAPAP